MNMIGRLGVWFLTFGIVWFYAWIYNPTINSNTVNFVGACAGLIVTLCISIDDDE